MRKLLYFTLLLVSSVLVAQVKITGKIVDQNNLPIPQAEVHLYGKDSLLVKLELSNNQGKFTVDAQKGAYIFKVVRNNQPVLTENIDVQEDKNLGDVKISSETAIKEVVISKKLIENKVDRIVFNIENSTKSNAVDAFEALKVTPGVRIINNQITMVGKSTVSVMINDKIMELSQADLENFLKSIPASDIKNIEIITTPPAKYDANGNSGLINIRLKKARNNSWSATLGSTYVQKTYADGSLLGSFNYNKNKLSITSSFNLRQGKTYNIEESTIYYPNETWNTNSDYKRKTKASNIKLGADYEISKKWKMGFLYLFNYGDIDHSDHPYTLVQDAGNAITKNIASNGQINYKRNIHSLNYFNEFKLDSIGKKITLNIDYFGYSNKDNRSYNGNYLLYNPDSQSIFAGINNNDQNINNFSSKIDVDFPIKWATLSFGGKVSHSKASNDIDAFNSGLVPAIPSSFSLNKSLFDYIENTQALYFSMTKKLSEKWQTQVGLRAEATQTKTLVQNQENVTNDYIKLFPTVYFSYNPSDDHNYSLSYSKRINRPSFGVLNPNLYYVNPFQTIVGNPALQPAFIDNVEFVAVNKNFTSKAYFSYEKSMYNQLFVPNISNNTSYFTYENFYNNTRLGINESYVFNKFKWWTSTNTLDLSYIYSKSTIPQIDYTVKGLNAWISTDNDFTLNENKTVMLNVGYWYSLPYREGLNKVEDVSSFYASLQLLFLNKDLKVSLQVSDLFRQEKTRVYTTNNIANMRAFYYPDVRAFQVSLTYKFGNKNIEGSQRSTGNQEERTRTGN